MESSGLALLADETDTVWWREGCADGGTRGRSRNLWARAIERLLTVFFSGVSLVLGWNLFKVGIVQDQQAEFANKSVTVKLQKVGPGVFFALFSIVGFVYALSRPLELKGVPVRATRPEGSSAAQETSISYEYKRDNPANEKEILAINSIEELAIPKALLTGTDRQKAAIQDARTILINTKRRILIDRYGSAFVKYEQLKIDIVKNPSLLDGIRGDERDTFYQIDHLMTDSLLSSK